MIHNQFCIELASGLYKCWDYIAFPGNKISRSTQEVSKFYLSAKFDMMVLDHLNDARNVEQKLHDDLGKYEVIPSAEFAGWTEYFYLEHHEEIVAAFRAGKEKYEGGWGSVGGHGVN